MHDTAAQYQDFIDRSDDRYADPAVAESRPALFPASSSQIHPHPHPLFIRQNGINSRALEPHGLANYQSPSPFSTPTTHHHQLHSLDHDSPQSWPSYDHPFPQSQHQGPVSYAPYPSPSPFPPPRLSPPPVHHHSFHFKGQGLTAGSTTAGHRMTLAGSLDPTTGIFYRTPEHPRLRTAQACEKCRTRKAKCSGEHPSCKRCLTRGLKCEYAKEGRVRGPNKPKSKPPARSTASATGTPTTSNSKSPNTSSSPTTNGRTSSRKRTSSNQSSAGSSDHLDSIPPSVRNTLLRTEHIVDDPPSMGNGRKPSCSRRNSHSGSLGEHFTSRSRSFETGPYIFRLNGEGTGSMPAPSLSLERGMENLFPFSSDQRERIGQGMVSWETTAGHQHKFQPSLTISTHPSSQDQEDLSRSLRDGSTNLISPLIKHLVPLGISQSHGPSNDSENSVGSHPQNLLPMGMNVRFQGGGGTLDDPEFMYPQAYAQPLSSMASSAGATTSRLSLPLVPVTGVAGTRIIEGHHQDYDVHHQGRSRRNDEAHFQMDPALRVPQSQFIPQRPQFPHPMAVDQIVTGERGHEYAKTAGNGNADMEHALDHQTSHYPMDLHC